MLALRNVSAGYGSFQALFDVSLDVNAGETVAVIGPNGAGKTTLLRVISRLIDASAGELSMEGKSLGRVPAYQVIGHGIAHVPENRRLFPRLSVEDNLRMGAFLPAAREKYAERLARVYELFPRMRERRSQPAGTLSGGEQQMCAIGRALKFYSSIRVDIRRIGSIKEGDMVVGSRTRVKIVKNKLAPPFREAEFDIMYNQGISYEGDLIDQAVDKKLVDKSGAWFSYKGERLGQGRDNARQFIREHPEIAETLNTKLREMLGLSKPAPAPEKGKSA